jgi:septum formation protein
LASASPARLATLRAAGIDPEVVVSEVDESAIAADSPAELAQLLARAKAEAVWSALGQPGDCLVIGADSILDFEGVPLGKPGTAAAAAALLRRTSGHSGVLVTGHHLIVAQAEVQRRTQVASTIVHVAALSGAEIDAYVATGEPLQVAGGFTIDGLGGPFIAGIEGDHHNVVGLSLPLLRLMLADCGVPWPTLWSSRPG